MKIVSKEVDSVNEFIDAIRIRVDVFIVEQKCQPGWEPDELDKESRHFIAIVDGKIVSTLRIRKTAQSEIKIERMATIEEYRGKKISKGLLEFVVKEIKKSHPKRIWMEAQVQAQKFYEGLGFKTVSKSYDLWNTGISHVTMEYMN
ncbi:MAG TPA: GNAT family N-acetyltransferase [Patescibacteria group bacterium]|nr:GNAT family N-acetyltransferase [Patescibacteria group bacterium]